MRLRSNLESLVAGFALLVSAPAALESQTGGASRLPAPSGEHAVGRTQFDWIDSSRPDTENPNRHREVAAWVWYPAVTPSNREAAEWMPGQWGEVFRSEYGKSHPQVQAESIVAAVQMRTHAYADAPAAALDRGFPVLLFAPGLGTTPLDYASVAEDVASHGYIVVGVVSPDFARASVFADGRVVRGHDPVELAARGGERPSTALALRAFEEAARSYARDLSFALSQLASASSGPLVGRADVNRVGVFGHSLGGAAALQCAHDDSRVRAAFDIDGSPIWSASNHPLRKPVLVLSAASTNLAYDAVLSAAAPGLHLRLSGTVHAFSSDIRLMPFTAPATASARSGSRADLLPPARALQVTATFVEVFFNQYLNGRTERLLSGPSADYPEITFEQTSTRPR
jgi:dienelactone hydrolase